MNDKFKRMYLIYAGGYATHKPYTIDEWFAARDYVNEYKSLIRKF